MIPIRPDVALVPGVRTECLPRWFSVGLYSYPTVLAVTGSTAVVLDTHAGQVSLISTRTRHVFAPVTVGTSP